MKLVCDPEIRLQITIGMLNLLYFGKITSKYYPSFKHYNKNYKHKIHSAQKI